MQYNQETKLEFRSQESIGRVQKRINEGIHALASSIEGKIGDADEVCIDMIDGLTDSTLKNWKTRLPSSLKSRQLFFALVWVLLTEGMRPEKSIEKTREWLYEIINATNLFDASIVDYEVDHLANLFQESMGFIKQDLVTYDQIYVFLRDILILPNSQPELNETPKSYPLKFTGFNYSLIDSKIIGRNIDIKNVNKKIELNRVTVITGYGGIGKTRLAAEIASKSGDFHDGVIWHEITSTSTFEGLIDDIKSHFRMDIKTDSKTVITTLGESCVLIVLDNAELCSYMSEINQFIKHIDISNGTRVLVTSRKMWDGFASYELSTLNEDAATQIVGEVLKRQLGNVRVVLSQYKSIAKVCHGHPRMIEIAIGMANDLPIEQVIDIVEQLSGANIENELEKLISVSLKQMDTNENTQIASKTLYHLAVCRGGFTYDTAKTLMPEGLSGLHLLRAWNFLVRDENKRYYIPSLIIDFLESRNLIPEYIRRDHFQYYLEYIKVNEQGDHYELLDIENRNIEAAFDWALRYDPEKALELCNACGHFFLDRGRYQQQEQWLKLVINKLGKDQYLASAYNALGNTYRILSDIRDTKYYLELSVHAYSNALQYRSPDIDPLEYSATLSNLGNAYQSKAMQEQPVVNLLEAIRYYREALIYRRLEDDPQSYAETTNNLAVAYVAISKHESNPILYLQSAIESFRIVLSIRKAEDNPRQHGRTLNSLGNAYFTLAEYLEPEKNFTEALNIYQQALEFRPLAASLREYATTLNNLAATYGKLAKFSNAVANLIIAKSLFVEVLKYRTLDDYPVHYAESLFNLGEVYDGLASIEKTKLNYINAFAAWEESSQIFEIHQRSYSSKLVRRHIQERAKALALEYHEGWLREVLYAAKWDVESIDLLLTVVE